MLFGVRSIVSLIFIGMSEELSEFDVICVSEVLGEFDVYWFE